MKTGRPKSPGESIHVRLDPENVDMLNEYVEQQNDSPAKVSKNSVINYALKKFLQKGGVKK